MSSFHLSNLLSFGLEPRPMLRLRLPQDRDAPVRVRRVQSWRDQYYFTRLPWLIYENDPYWVPPLLIEVKEFLNPRKHPFYQHGVAAQFLACQDGCPVGRILVSEDPRYNAKHGTRVGCFGMFESIEDPRVAHALFEAAAQWMRQRGLTHMMGPIDYSINYPCGLLIEGFQYPPRIMMNHNPPYYAELCESWGFQKAKDLYAWWFVKDNENLRCWMQRVRRFQERSRIKIRPFNLSNFEAEMARCVEVYTVTRYDQWGFIDLTPAELRYFAKRLAQFARPDLVLVAEDNGKAVGFSITVPDLNEAIRPLNGRLTSWGMPIGAVRLFQRLKQVKTARVMVLGVIPGYRHRGIAELMILQTIERGVRDAGFDSAELSWTLEDNHAINNTIQAVGGKLYKRYRIYEKCIAE
ncbi:MAG: GNAT family N-acetyltransferase [Thermogutta sp.]|uniref:GNAT family N-acetyltransferase n=1 Tax=Thermogutta sp. TaxID=1962930 RepID=UPI00198C7133|nr:GNAT family N-acetyltransferase [Thermogutta sp.]MBC7351192.1 GNAT family N-acetyltransferase [Thermogutta sp.]